MPVKGSKKAVCKRGHPRIPENLGSDSRCRLCKAITDRKWRKGRSRERIEETRKYNHEWGEKHPVERRKAQRKQYKRHPEKLREKSRKHREENPEYLQNYRKDHPEKFRESNRKRRAQKAGNEKHFTEREWQSLLDSTGHICLCCRRTEAKLAALGLRLVRDHVVALQDPSSKLRGHRDEISNIQPLCHGKGGCNNKKGTKHVDYRKGL